MTETVPVHTLAYHASRHAVDAGVPYLAKIIDTKEYGLFVQLTPSCGSDLHALVYQDNIADLTTLHEYEIGERCIVELIERRANGDLSVRLHTSDHLENDDLPATIPESWLGGIPEERTESPMTRVRKRLDEILDRLDDIDHPRPSSPDGGEVVGAQVQACSEGDNAE